MARAAAKIQFVCEYILPNQYRIFGGNGTKTKLCAKIVPKKDMITALNGDQQVRDKSLKSLDR